MLKIIVYLGVLVQLAISDYSKDLISILKLEYQSSKSLERVDQLLSEIAGSLRKSQEQDDRLNKTRQAECTAEITFLDRPIEVMYSEITRAKQIVADKEPKFNKVQALLGQKQQELDFLASFISNQENKYLQQITELKNSYIEHEQALKAVINSLDLLKAAEYEVTSSSVHDNKEHTEIIGLSFLQSDQESFSRLVDVIIDIQKNLQGYLDANTKRKVQIDDVIIDIQKNLQGYLDANTKRKVQIDEEYKNKGLLEEIRAGVGEIWKNLDQESLDLAEDIEEANRMIREASEECGSMVRAKSDKETECGAWTKQFSYETQKRNEEMAIIVEIMEQIHSDLSVLE
ncbi:hypothetical protein SteCoe_30147 [Stentor coeruleus]|uniref:Uncharacterized protein n=1 Tax=Stentor coeruleus TaxID=5963 RepID=A0A1R2B4B1_9CILI|nr:hypothetical protein SteCoe_30147 [Stentor coeruleus]